MTPEDRKLLNDLNNRLRAVEEARNTSFVAELIRRLGVSTVTISTGSTSGTTIAVRNEADDGSETVAGEYSGALTLTDLEGNTYTIGHY